MGHSEQVSELRVSAESVPVGGRHDLVTVDGGTELTVRQDRADFSDEQVAATIAGYNAFIDDIEKVVAGMTA